LPKGGKYIFFGDFYTKCYNNRENGKIGSYIVKLAVNMDLGSEIRMRARFEE